MVNEPQVPEPMSLEQLARPFIQMLHDVTGLDTVFLTQIDWEAGKQDVLYAANGPRLETPEGASIPWTETICRRAMMGGPSYSANVPEDYPGNAIAEAFSVQTYITFPVVTPDPDGTIFGTICGASTEAVELDEKAVAMIKHVADLIGERVARERDIERAARIVAAAERDRDHMQTVAGNLAAAVEQRDAAARTFELKSEELRRLNLELADLAVTDPLTMIHNRRGFQQHWDAAASSASRHGHPVTLVLIDLDGFKQVNDTHGHSAGDCLLKAFASLLLAQTRADDVVARLGGDEFIIGLSHADALEAKRMCKRIRESATAQELVAGVDWPLRFSAGVASTATTPRLQLVDAADRALYRAKELGGMRAEVYFGELTEPEGSLSA
jgi:diguanylate cyclase